MLYVLSCPIWQVASYGGYLKFYLSYETAADEGQTFVDVDVEIMVSVDAD